MNPGHGVNFTDLLESLVLLKLGNHSLTLAARIEREKLEPEIERTGRAIHIQRFEAANSSTCRPAVCARRSHGPPLSSHLGRAAARTNEPDALPPCHADHATGGGPRMAHPAKAAATAALRLTSLESDSGAIKTCTSCITGSKSRKLITGERKLWLPLACPTLSAALDDRKALDAAPSTHGRRRRKELSRVRSSVGTAECTTTDERERKRERERERERRDASTGAYQCVTITRIAADCACAVRSSLDERKHALCPAGASSVGVVANTSNATRNAEHLRDGLPARPSHSRDCVASPLAHRRSLQAPSHAPRHGGTEPFTAAHGGRRCQRAAAASQPDEHAGALHGPGALTAAIALGWHDTTAVGAAAAAAQAQAALFATAARGALGGTRARAPALETRGTANDAGAASNEGGHDVQQLLETYERWHAAQLEALGSNVSHAASSSRTQQQQHDDDSIGDGDGAAALSPFRLHSDASSVGVVLWRPKAGPSVVLLSAPPLGWVAWGSVGSRVALRGGVVASCDLSASQTGLAAALDALAITAMVALCTGRLLLVEIGGWEAALASPLDWRWDERKQQLLKVHQGRNAALPPLLARQARRRRRGCGLLHAGSGRAGRGWAQDTVDAPVGLQR
eukprot:scaffold1564_cov389-Prasinococcus_capsulatus_cf.AAC.24